MTQFVEAYVWGMLAFDSDSLLAMVRRMLLLGRSVYSIPLDADCGLGATGLAFKIKKKKKKKKKNVKRFSDFAFERRKGFCTPSDKGGDFTVWGNYN